MPFNSPRCLSNPDRCSSFLATLAQIEGWKDFDGFIAVGIQEAWGWRTGVVPTWMLRLLSLMEYIPVLGHLMDALVAGVTIVVGGLPLISFIPIKYDPKSIIIGKLNEYLPFSYNNCDIPLYRKFFDCGLTVLCNRRASMHGFERYIAAACDDSLANKGWIWLYFEKQRLLLINTHMQAAGAGRERLFQLREIRSWLKREWAANGRMDKCIILGDFNIDMGSHPERLKVYDAMQSGMLYEEDMKHEDEDPVDAIKLHVSCSVTVDDELERDPLTGIGKRMQGQPKRSLVDNFRKMKAQHDGGKLTKKAYINIPYYFGKEFHKINLYEATFKRADYNIDHIFANFECKNIRNRVLCLEKGKLSDHGLVIAEFDE